MPKAGAFKVNQGRVAQTRPEHLLFVSLDDADTSTPTWTDLSSRLRSYGIDRGRSSELQDFDAGTGRWVLDNRDRELDPSNAVGSYYPGLRPMNRVWHRIQWAGDTFDIFTGWAESWEQDYPGMVDATATLTAADEFKPLTLDRLPTMSPPRDTYQDLVMSDEPIAYWRMSSGTPWVEPPVIGPELRVTGYGAAAAIGSNVGGPIVGNNPDPDDYVILGAGTALATAPLEPYATPDLSDASECAFEVWMKVTDPTPASTDYVLRALPTVTGGEQFVIALLSTGAVQVHVRNSAGTDYNVDTPTAILADSWTHIVGTVESGTLKLYRDGALVAQSGAWVGTVDLADPPTSPTTINSCFVLGDPVDGQDYTELAEVAIYRTGLTADRVAAHYAAARSRGFPRNEKAHNRINAVLDAVNSHAPRALRASNRSMTGAFMRGQAPIDEVRDAVHAEAPDGCLFAAADGTLTFLDADHRSVSPWTSPRATFGDSGSELPYQEISLDYSDSFIVNEWSVALDGKEADTASDAASIAAYKKRSQSLTGIKVSYGATVAQDIADALLAKTKDPMLRVTSLSPKTSDAATLAATLGLELADRVRVKRRPPGGGSAIDQQSYVEHISVSGTPKDVWPVCRLGVSPV